jgi:glutamate dehydrogenase
LVDIVRAAQEVPADDYYDRLALDRALSAIEAGHRRLTGQVVEAGHVGADGAAAFLAGRGAEVARISSGVEGIVASGLTLSKVVVAASLLGDLARE